MRMTSLLTRIFCTLILGWALTLSPQRAMAQDGQERLSFARGLSGNFLSGRFANEVKDTEAAAQFFLRALNRDPDNPALLQQTFYLHLINGDVEAALPFAAEMLNYDPGFDLARTALGVQALKQGNFADAVAEFDAATKAQPLENLTNSLLSAWAETGRDDLNSALGRIDALEGPDWYDGFLAFHGGLMAHHLGAEDEALIRVTRAYEADQTALRTVEAFARLHAQQGAVDKGLAAIATFKESLPRHPYMNAVEADLSAGLSKRLVRSTRAGAAELLFGLGAALGRESGTELPTIYLQLALYLDPAADIAIMALADLYQDAELYAPAVSLIETMPRNSPFYEGAQIEAALNLGELARVDEAIRKLNGIARQAEDPAAANLTLGNLLRFKERFAEANDVYTLIIDDIETPEPRHWSLYYARGITFERTDRWPEAEADFKQALELFPDQPLVLNYLGYSWIDKDINLEVALALIEKAVEQRPDEGFIIDSLGWAYYKLGRFDDAVTQLERAATLMADDPVIHDHLGDAYWRVGRTLEAQFKWRHALALEPEAEEDVALLEAKLADGLPSLTVDETADANASNALTLDNTAMDADIHVVSEGESLWDIAELYYEDGARFLEILTANRTVLPDDGRLETGLELRIPR